MKRPSYAKINRAIRRLEARGYTVNAPNYMRGLTQKGTEKQRFTQADIEKITSFRTKDLYQYSYKEFDGVKLQGLEARKKERSLSAIKGHETRRLKLQFPIPKTETNYQDLSDTLSDYLETDDYYLPTADETVSKPIKEFTMAERQQNQSLVSLTIISEFTSEENWINRRRNPDLMDRVYSLVDNIIGTLESEYPNSGRYIFAEALQKTKNAGEFPYIYASYSWDIDIRFQKIYNAFDNSNIIEELKKFSSDITLYDEEEVDYEEEGELYHKRFG